MQIAKLTIKNLMSISNVEIAPGKITLITGLNNQGKTSILRALQLAAEGSGDGTLVKRGEDAAEILVEFDDQTSIRRRIRKEGDSTVQVRKGDFKADKPQSLLAGLFGSGAFNPLELLDPKKRTEVLLSAIPLQITESDLKEAAGDCPVEMPPLDYSQHGLKVAQQAHKYFYQRRAEANKIAKEKAEIVRVKRAELPAMPTQSAETRTGAELEVRRGEIRASITVEMAKNKEVEAHAAKVKAVQQSCEMIQKRIGGYDREIAIMEEKIRAAREASRVDEELYAKSHKELLKLENENTTVGPDQDKIKALNEEATAIMEEINRRSHAQSISQLHDHVRHMESSAKDVADFAAKIDGAVEALGAGFRAKLISRTKLPITGLSFENDAFTLDGTSIENLSSSQAVKLAVAVARSVAGPAKLICIDGAEALDEQTYSALVSEIHGDDFQYFISKVGPAFESLDDTTVVEMSGGEAKISTQTNPQEG